MYTLLKMEEAAKELGLGITALKKYCRKHGIKRWPHRQVKEKYLCKSFQYRQIFKLKSLDNLISALERLVSKADSIQGGEEECVQVRLNFQTCLALLKCIKFACRPPSHNWNITKSG